MEGNQCQQIFIDKRAVLNIYIYVKGSLNDYVKDGFEWSNAISISNL